MPLSREQLKTEFWQLQEQIETIENESGPMRDARDAKVNAYDAEIRELDKAIKEVESNLGNLKDQQGMCSRALGGQTGERPAKAA